MGNIETIKVKPWGDGQGDFVVINKDDFDPDLHEALDDKPAEQKPRRQAKPKSADPVPPTDMPAEQGDAPPAADGE